jgi:hypothetical protein
VSELAQRIGDYKRQRAEDGQRTDIIVVNPRVAKQYALTLANCGLEVISDINAPEKYTEDVPWIWVGPRPRLQQEHGWCPFCGRGKDGT